MSTQESIPPLNLSVSGIGSQAAESAEANSFWQRVSELLERAGEWLNPLLVKEVRQALKSRQFSLTFTLLLGAGWIWSIIGITSLGPGMQFRDDGPAMFKGYYFILAFPLLLIVPYSAFRSLIAEREDNTYELVAITTLKPRQLVNGKLGSAMAQMLVYLSAIAPCLAFTYLLHGIDVLTICWIIFWTFLASLGFSLCALLLATAAKEKHWQVVFSVAIIVGLFMAFIGAFSLCVNFLTYIRLPFHDDGFWIANCVALTIFAGAFAMIYQASAAQLTFTAENRSTPLRITMLVHQAMFAGWMGYALCEIPRSQFQVLPTIGAVYALVSIVYWYFMGAFMTGEVSELSPRVKRSLPKTLLGRLLFTWFNPGPGTGYMYALVNSLSALLIGGVLAWTGEILRGSSTWPGRFGHFSEVLLAMVVGLSYSAIYLGLISLLLRVMRRYMAVTLAVSFLMNAALLAAGIGIPRVIRTAIDYRGTGYSLLHITDPFWTIDTLLDSATSAIFSLPLLCFIPPLAFVVVLLNLMYIIPEIRHVRVALPVRVEEEEQALAPVVAAAPQPASPWD